MNPRQRLAAAVSAPRTIDLPGLMEVAALQTRVDRKYLVPWDTFGILMERLAPSSRVLEIDGRRSFRYESVYFDTPQLDSYLQAARGRRHKFKVRTRTYIDSGSSMLEVKTTGGRGETVKERSEHPMADRRRLGPAAQSFVGDRVNLRHGPSSLAPVAITTYARATLVDEEHTFRMTSDAGLHVADPDGRSARMRDQVLVETKAGQAPCAADRLLWRLGVRPTRISKFCVGLAALNPWLPANRWNRTLRAAFDWQPVRTGYVPAA